ncbi:MAG: clostripain-related cysteine peptidase [Dysgonomonas sp.]
MENNKQNKPNWKGTFATLIFSILIFIFVTCLLASCTKDEDRQEIVDKVLLVYLGGDNNLSGESYSKLQAITRGYDTNPNARILVYHDSQGGSPRLIEINNKNKATILEMYDNENSADPAVFTRVITKIKELYPQAAYNLLIFSHASGWTPKGSYSDPSLRSIMIDGKDEMELSDFASAIPNNMFEYIIFEACYMAGIEVAYQLKDKSKYIVASSAEIVSPGFTEIYEKHINELVYGNPLAFMRETFRYFDDWGGYMRSATLSVIKTEKLDALADFVKSNCDLKIEVYPEEIQHFDRNTSHLFYDFGDYYTKLITEDLRLELQQLITDCVIWKASTPYFMEGYNGFAINEHSGLTVYIKQNRYPKLNESYSKLDWDKAIR